MAIQKRIQLTPVLPTLLQVPAHSDLSEAEVKSLSTLYTAILKSVHFDLIIIGIENENPS